MNEAIDFSTYINRYIKDEHTDYSILINAPWGAGKTHFVTKFCEEKQDEDSVEYDGNNYVYFSLKGVSDISKVINSLFLRIFLNLKTEKKNSVSEIIEKINIDSIIELIDNKKITNFYKSLSLISDVTMSSYINYHLERCKDRKIILFLDDLERVSDSICIKDLLGELDSQFIEKNIKIIYVADEDKILKNDKQNSPYKETKEKFIRRTFLFNPNKEDIFEKILLNYFSEPDEKELISSFLECFSEEQPNLRSVKYCCELYKDILEQSRSFKPNNEYLSPLPLLPSICEYTKFININNISKKVFLEQCPGEYSYIKNYLSSQSENSEDKKNDSEDKKLCEEFFKKCGESDSITLYTNRFLINFIFDGYLNETELKEFLKIEIKNEDPLKLLANNIYELEYDNVVNASKGIIKKLTAKEYTIREVNLLIKNFLPIVKKLKPQDIFDNYEKREGESQIEFIKNTIESLIIDSVFSENTKETLEEVFSYKIKNQYYDFPSYTDHFDEILLESFTKYSADQNKEKINNLLEAIKKAEYSNIFSEIDEHKVFSMLKHSEKLNEIPEYSNKSILFLIRFINAKIIGLGNAYQFYTTEIPVLKELQGIIHNSIKDGEEDFLKNDLLKKLESTIKNAIDHIISSKSAFTY